MLTESELLQHIEQHLHLFWKAVMSLCTEFRSNQLIDEFPWVLLELKVGTKHSSFISEGFQQAESFREEWSSTFSDHECIDVTADLFLGFWKLGKVTQLSFWDSAYLKKNCLNFFSWLQKHGWGCFPGWTWLGKTGPWFSGLALRGELYRWF